jgi:chromosome partitioning protein
VNTPWQQLVRQYTDLLREVYGDCAGESSAPPQLPPELQLQSWWAAGLLPRRGQSQAHGAVEILEPGRWNRCAGPDFTHAEIELAGMDGRERVLGDALDAARKDFDYIFIDCPPSLGLITLNALCAADGVLIPIQCEYYALEGVSALMGTIQKVQKINRRLSIQGVVLTMLDARTNLGIQVAQEVRKVFKGKVYDAVVPRNVRLGEAPSHGLPIHLYDARSLGAQSYQALAKEFLAR